MTNILRDLADSVEKGSVEIQSLKFEAETEEVEQDSEWKEHKFTGKKTLVIEYSEA